MKKTIIYIFLGLILCITIYKACSLINSLPYTYSAKRGYSRRIAESKKRKVFIKNLNYRVVPDSLNINKIQFFIEKGFLYGQTSVWETDSLKPHTINKYQFIVANEYKSGYFLKCLNFQIMEKWELKRPFLSDTVYFDVYPTNNFEKDMPIGKIKVWE